MKRMENLYERLDILEQAGLITPFVSEQAKKIVELITECAETDLEAFPAIYLPIQDVNAIVDSVTSILENSKYRDQLSLKTFQYSQALTPETYEKRLISIFKSI